MPAHRWLIAIALAASIGPARMGAQLLRVPPDSVRRSALVLVTSETVDRIRLGQLLGSRVDGRLLLRSASSLTPQMGGGNNGPAVSAIAPQFLVVSNSALPFSQNNGSLWAGRGIGSRALAGVKLESGRVRLILAPELVSEENRDWLLRRFPYNQAHNTPSVPADRSGGGYVFPFYVNTFPIDQPLRFGNKRIQRLDPGQSSLFVRTGNVEIGASTESEWWGPGIRNALILSNNAPGFPHLLLRTMHPMSTRFGKIEARWLVGGLTESKYFDTVSTNNVRSLASLAATIQTGWDPNLTFGFARSVFATASGWGPVPLRWLDVLANTHRANDRPVADTALRPGGRDQILSLFGRWVFPPEGVEIYSEWARTELPRNLKDALIAPNHTQGYTLGLQWARPVRPLGLFRIQAEVTQLEQSPTRRDRPIGSWYTSRRVVQGYTNRGEVIGASIGPGASSAWLALDYLAPSWRFGVFAGRIRWNEDVHNATQFPVYVYYCNHDVTIYPGARAAARGRFGSLSVDYSLQNRLNAFFQNDGGCPNVGNRLDIRNNTLSITFSPFSRL
ncbi:MAG: capsule assembly Wzi family protein [Gemmatimonadota bacterium]|nr:capsule assembly Wzi family protein [Gemmatimonadota bacterium]